MRLVKYEFNNRYTDFQWRPGWRIGMDDLVKQSKQKNLKELQNFLTKE